MDNITYTAKELAEKIQVSKGLIYKLARENKIPYIKIGDRVVFRKTTIDEWLREKEIGINPTEKE